MLAWFDGEINDGHLSISRPLCGCLPRKKPFSATGCGARWPSCRGWPRSRDDGNPSSSVQALLHRRRPECQPRLAARERASRSDAQAGVILGHGCLRLCTMPHFRGFVENDSGCVRYVQALDFAGRVQRIERVAPLADQTPQPFIFSSENEHGPEASCRPGVERLRCIGIRSPRIENRFP